MTLDQSDGKAVSKFFSVASNFFAKCFFFQNVNILCQHSWQNLIFLNFISFFFSENGPEGTNLLLDTGLEGETLLKTSIPDPRGFAFIFLSPIQILIYLLY